MSRSKGTHGVPYGVKYHVCYFVSLGEGYKYQCNKITYIKQSENKMVTFLLQLNYVINQTKNGFHLFSMIKNPMQT